MTDQVIVAGGGPTGLLTAPGLGRSEIKVIVAEAEATANSSPRTGKSSHLRLQAHFALTLEIPPDH